MILGTPYHKVVDFIEKTTKNKKLVKDNWNDDYNGFLGIAEIYENSDGKLEWIY